MGILGQVLDGSLLSHERLMEAREQYAPTSGALSPERAFGRWTQRMSVQSELASAREIAGLTEEELSAMEAEFVRSPKRPRSAAARSAMSTGIALAAVGALGLAAQSFLDGKAAVAQQAVLLGSAACALIGLVVLAYAVVSAFGTLHLELGHGTTGLFFGRLDEEHPWLFKTMSLAHDPAAEEYRRRVVSERGWLRGVDYVMMKEAVRARDKMEQTLPTRLVAERIQLFPAHIGGVARSQSKATNERGNGRAGH